MRMVSHNTAPARRLHCVRSLISISECKESEYERNKAFVKIVNDSVNNPPTLLKTFCVRLSLKKYWGTSLTLKPLLRQVFSSGLSAGSVLGRGAAYR